MAENFDFDDYINTEECANPGELGLLPEEIPASDKLREIVYMNLVYVIIRYPHHQDLKNKDLSNMVDETVSEILESNIEINWVPAAYENHGKAFAEQRESLALVDEILKWKSSPEDREKRKMLEREMREKRDMSKEEIKKNKKMLEEVFNKKKEMLEKEMKERKAMSEEEIRKHILVEAMSLKGIVLYEEIEGWMAMLRLTQIQNTSPESQLHFFT